MRIEDFLARHGIQRNPFANAEEAQGDGVFANILESKQFRYGHPQWPKFCGAPPGTQSSIVFGLKGSGKTAMRLALSSSIKAHNQTHEDDRVLLIEYSDFNYALDNWQENMDRKLRRQRRSARRRRGEPEPEATLARDWSLAHHVDAILSQATLLFPDLLQQKDARPRKWDPHVKSDVLFLAAAFLPQRSLEYRRNMETLSNRLFTGGAKLKRRVSRILGGVFTLGLAPLREWVYSRRVAKRLASAIDVVENNTVDRAWGFRFLSSRFLKSQPLLAEDVDAHHDGSRFELLGRLLRVARQCGYARIAVVIDKVDEPELIRGNYDRISDFILPLWNNKLLQTEGIEFKMLLPAQLYRTIRKADSNLLNTARLDKTNTIYPFTWSGNHLYEMLTERLNVCREGDEEYELSSLLDAAVSRDALIQQLSNMRIPRYANKFMNRLLSEACEGLLASDVTDAPVISLDVFHRVCSVMENEIKNEARDLLEMD